MLDYLVKDQENLHTPYRITCPKHPIHQEQQEQQEQQERQHVRHIVSYTDSLNDMMGSTVVVWEQEADTLTCNDEQQHQLGSTASKASIDGKERKASRRTMVT